MQLQHLLSDDQLAKLKSLSNTQVVSKKVKPEIKSPRKDNKPVVTIKKRRTFTKDNSQ